MKSKDFQFKRPGHGTCMTTPRSVSITNLLGKSISHMSVTVCQDEHKHLQRLYGYVDEKPGKKPPPPTPPKREDFKTAWEFKTAQDDHERACKIHANWQDPQKLLQAGADRNLFRYAEADGLRLIAWLARYCEPGDDPLKVLIQLVSESGIDIDPSDMTWSMTKTTSAGQK